MNDVIQLTSRNSFDLEDAGAGRILIVDDERGIRQVFTEWLEHDYECKTAASTDEALQYLTLEPFALVITDMGMPGRNGLELLREIRSRYSDTGVIRASGSDGPQRVRAALRLGALDYITKPCELEVLTLTVERALMRRSQEGTRRIARTNLKIEVLPKLRINEWCWKGALQDL